MTHEGGPPNAARPPTPFRPVTAPPAYSKSLFHTHSTCAMHACVPTVCHAWPPTPGDHFHQPNSYCEIACPPPPTHNPHTYSQTPILPPRSAWSDADPPMARPTTVSTFPAALAGDLYATARQPPALHMANQPPQPIFHTSRQTHAYAAASKAAQEAYHRAGGLSPRNGVLLKPQVGRMESCRKVRRDARPRTFSAPRPAFSRYIAARQVHGPCLHGKCRSEADRWARFWTNGGEWKGA